MYEKQKQLPEVVRQVGEIKGNVRVYIEEYAYGYLHELKRQAENKQIRAALYGNTFSKEGMRFYLIYGIVHEQEENDKQTMTAGLRGEALFSEYEKLGFVNLYRKNREMQQLDGCYVFYETNEAMQEYLLAERKSRPNDEISERTAELYRKNKRNVARGFFRNEILQKLFLGVMLLVAAIAASVINHYEGIREFVVMAAKAAQEIR